jgi:hypothetical protein
MVIYNLICKQNHQFEGWFPGAEGYEERVARDQVSCPICGDTSVQKLPHACAIRTKKEPTEKRRQSVNTVGQPVSESDAKELLLRLHHHVRENCEDVGPRFAEQARRMFNGEVDKRSIYGVATPSEREELETEGVPHIVLPKPELDS